MLIKIRAINCYRETQYTICVFNCFFLEYGVATQRMCLQRGPSDSEDRCAYTKWQYRKVLMCFCKGDLCNSATQLNISTIILVFASLFPIIIGLNFR